MKLLLDTHVWIWSLIEPSKLVLRTRRALEAKQNELWLSPISIWEFLILARRGRIELNLEVGQWVRRALEASPMREAPMTSEVALATRTLRLPHRDPADEFLVATASVFDLTLVTADRRIIDSKAVRTLANR